MVLSSKMALTEGGGLALESLDSCMVKAVAMVMNE